MSDHSVKKQKQPRPGSWVFLLPAAAFALAAAARYGQLQRVWAAGMPETDLLLPLWATLAVTGTVIALWSAVKRAARRSALVGWAGRLLLTAGFAFLLFLLVPEIHIMNPGSWVFCTASIAGIVGCLFWPLLQKRSLLRRLSRILATVYLIAGLLCLYLGLNMLLGQQGPAAPAGTPALVLGSQVNGNVPSADLQARINTAAKWAKAHPSSKVVACGGKGSGETISEAECICRGLEQQGIASSRIILEDASTNTEQNVHNAIIILRTPTKSAALSALTVITDDYHTCRGRLLVQSFGLLSYPVPSPTPSSCLVVSVMREMLALPARLVQVIF